MVAGKRQQRDEVTLDLVTKIGCWQASQWMFLESETTAYVPFHCDNLQFNEWWGSHN
jgi:hypothetical protein